MQNLESMGWIIVWGCLRWIKTHIKLKLNIPNVNVIMGLLLLILHELVLNCHIIFRNVLPQGPYNDIRYSIPTFVNPRIAEYFGVEPITGEVYLKKSLLQDSQNQKTWGVSNFKHC